MEIKKSIIIEIEEYELDTFKELMILVERSIKNSMLSNHISIDLVSKKNKKEVLDMVHNFNNVKFDDINISSNNSQIEDDSDFED